MTKLISFSLLILVIIMAGFTGVVNPDANYKYALAVDNQERILVNQLGFFPESPKKALIRLESKKFEVRNVKNGKVVFTGVTKPLKYYIFSGDSVGVADFSEFLNPGFYQICLNNNSICSPVFEIRNSVYANLSKAAIKALYLNRSGMDITEEYAGKWAHAGGHPDTQVFIHASAASAKRLSGTTISSPGGWYDAGDYNKYIVNSAISTYTLILFSELFPDYCQGLNLNIPESRNDIPDVTDELLYNLKWMLTMQDPEDGGVYHKLTEKAFCDFIMPDLAKEPRFVVLKSTSASLDFASTMAAASRLLKKSKNPELNALASTCLVAAKKAFSWAKTNPNIYYKNPEDIKTGQYDDTSLSDELFWATAELGLAEHNEALLKSLDFTSYKAVVPSWDQVGMLATISMAVNSETGMSDLVKQSKNVILLYVDSLINIAVESPYLIGLQEFRWGSNSDVANQALLKIIAFNVSGEKKYLTSVQNDLDYLLGRNATGYCFVSGFGTKQVKHIHHRPSGADGVDEPYPGFLVGGPNTVVLNDCPEVKRSLFPAKSFTDSQCSYSTNEIAINWNAPLFFLTGAMDAYNSKNNSQ